MCLGTVCMAMSVDARGGYQIPWNRLPNGSVLQKNHQCSYPLSHL